jgi:hypothetical protein
MSIATIAPSARPVAYGIDVQNIPTSDCAAKSTEAGRRISGAAA